MSRIGQEQGALGKLIRIKQSAGGKINCSGIEKVVESMSLRKKINIIIK